MSSILDALEKASRKGTTGTAGATDSLAAQSSRERRLKEENLEHRRRMRLLMLGIVVLALVLAGVAAMTLKIMARPEKVRVVQAPAPPAPKPQIITVPAESKPQPTPTPIVVTIIATPIPGTPTPTPEPTATPIPTPRPELDLKGLYKDGQIVSAAELGWQITGTFIKDSGSVAIINEQQVKTGAKFEGVEIVDIQERMLTVDVGGGTLIRVRF